MYFQNASMLNHPLQSKASQKNHNPQHQRRGKKRKNRPHRSTVRWGRF